ncbi:MAG TPA: UDP-glucose 4-epimerase GalE [Geminicoccaceae bacterium]|nr:UDP-glucose 4-epimerase GalE [Geminicoccaceae bacterium]
MGRGPSDLRVLVTGGAGYVGSHILRHLVRAGHEAVAFDNLYSGHPWAVVGAELITGDLGDEGRLGALLAERRFDAVIHSAAHIWVGESVQDPAKYYRNNTCNAIRLFDLCARHGVRRVVFSSTAAVYGDPGIPLIPESTPLRPINPYGASKMMAERALADIAAAHGLDYVVFRYFNVAGADAEARIGEATPDNSHLIKVALETAMGLRSGMRINGTDFDTPDGTCIRDYVHVDDLAGAHVAAIGWLMDGGGSATLNCGYGHGFSVREVLDACRRITGIDFPIEEGPRRPGDPPVLVSDTRLIRERFGWRPAHDDLDHIVATAWRWEQRLGEMRGAARGPG